MTDRARHDASADEPELPEILELDNFTEAIEFLLKQPMQRLSEDQRAHAEARFKTLEDGVTQLDGRIDARMTEVETRLGEMQAVLKAAQEARVLGAEASREEAASLAEAVAQIQHDLDQLREQLTHLVAFSESDSQKLRLAVDRDRLWSRLLMASLGVLLVVLIGLELITP